MIDQIRQRLERFAVLASQIPGAQPLAEGAWLVRRRHTEAARPIDVTFLAITHGNEVGGLDVLLELMQLYRRPDAFPALNVCFVLGNPDAAKQNQRQLESDLNRSFGLATKDTLEARRCKLLEQIFRDTDVLVDFHQTQGPSEQPFYISRFDSYSYLLFRALMPTCAGVTYWNQSFSKGGMTTVNYHLSAGGHGFGIELGERGFCSYQTELGVSLGLRLLDIYCRFKPDYNSIESDERLFTFQQTVVSKTGVFDLVPGLKNFTELPANFHLGTVDGQPVSVSAPGAILFPKYTKPQSVPDCGFDVCRLLRPVSSQELRHALAAQVEDHLTVRNDD